MKSLDYYRAILGVDATVSPGQLRQAYLDLVKRWHPDRLTHNPELQKEAESKLKEINEAYKELLSALGKSQGPSKTQPHQPQAEAPEQREPRKAPKTSAAPHRRRSSRRRGEYTKKRPLGHILSARLFAATLGVFVFFLAATAFLNHQDPESMTTFSGVSVPVRSEPTPVARRATEAETAAARVALGEKMKEHYDNTLKLLTLHEEERARIYQDYLRQREMYTKNMLSREELRQVEDALTAATERIAEDKRWLAKAELAIAEAALAKEKLNPTKSEKEP